MTDHNAHVPAPDRVSALILGAGEGTRHGSAKAFLEAGGVTCAERAVRLLRRFASEVILGLRAEDLARGGELLGDECTLLAGGTTRQATFERLLATATREFVVVHDVARPHAEADQCRAILSACAIHGAATPAIAAGGGDSISLKEGDWLGASLPRDRVVRTQTPYAFRREPLLAAMQRAHAEGWQETSVTTLFTRAGGRVFVVPGDPNNLKVTYPEDWARSRRILEVQPTDDESIPAQSGMHAS